MDEVDVARFRGLDMNHGFIRSIVKNQIDRDEYHKVMEERKAEVNEKVKSSKQRQNEPSSSHRESNVYVPPHRRNGKEEVKEKSEKAKAARSQIGPSVITRGEESHLREKVRSRVKAKMDDIDDLSIPSSSSGRRRKRKRKRSCSGRRKSLDKKQIFTLNMKNNEGEEIEIPVLSTDSAARLAKQLGRKYNFSEEQCRMLRITLDRALEEHGAS